MQTSSLPLPTLRRDLRWSRHEVRGEEVWFLNDPQRRSYFRFSAAVAFLLKRLDGVAEAAAILRAFEAEFGQSLDAEDLQAVIQQAADANLLAGHPGAESPPEPRGAPRPSLLARILQVQVGVFDPDALLTRTERSTRVFFTPAAQLLWAALIVAGLGVVVANLRTIDVEGAGLMRWQTLPLLLPIILLVTVLHEFGHGLTCKHFGGEVREMGFLLIYFQPAFYCDISDAWMLPRRARLWSVAAGTWVQLGIWAIAAFTWRVTAPESYLHAAGLIVVLVAGLGAFMNLNPFIKLDGYYFLSDWLEIPNLRARAFTHLRRSLHYLMGAAPAEPGAPDAAVGRTPADPLPPRDAREAGIFRIYGISAALLCGGLLLYFLEIAHGFTLRHLGVGSVAILWLMVASLAARPLGAVVMPVGRAWARVIRRPHFSRSAIALISCAAVIAALFLIPWELRVSADVRFEPLSHAVVRNEIEGIIEKVLVAENQDVRQGDLLFELSSRHYRASLEQAEAEIQKAGAELALLMRGAREEEIRGAESRLEKELTREEYARRDHAKSKELFERKIIPHKELLAAEEELAVRQKEVKEARGQIDLVRAGSRPEELERVRAEIGRLESVARLARQNLDRALLRAPITGRVVTPRLELKAGQKVEPGTALCELVDARRLRAEVEVPEGEAAEVKVGQKVKIKARAFPERAFWGEVVSVASAAQAEVDPDRASFLPAPQSRIRVDTEVDNAEGLLKPEMTGNAKIYCGKRLLIHLMTRRLIRYLRTEFLF